MIAQYSLKRTFTACKKSQKKKEIKKRRNIERIKDQIPQRVAIQYIWREDTYPKHVLLHQYWVDIVQTRVGSQFYNISFSLKHLDTVLAEIAVIPIPFG